MPERIWREVALAREMPSLSAPWGFTVRRYQQRLYWVKYLPGQSEKVLLWRDIASRCRCPTVWRTDAAAGGPLRPPRMKRSPFAFAPAVICISSGATAAAS
jgi:tRNA(Ile)-lysidine synthase